MWAGRLDQVVDFQTENMVWAAAGTGHVGHAERRGQGQGRRAPNDPNERKRWGREGSHLIFFSGIFPNPYHCHCVLSVFPPWLRFSLANTYC